MNPDLASISSMKSRPVSDDRPIVFIVDDDISVRESLGALIAEAGLRPQVFASAEDFLNHVRQLTPACLVLDLSLPHLNGLELQKRISGNRTDLPIIFITGHGDIPNSVQAMKAGAVEFLTKPFEPDVLLGAIQSAIEKSRTSLAEQAELSTLKARHESLSRRERDVMAVVVRGQLNKQAAAELGISEITVKAHRGRVMRKMKAKSLAELVKIAMLLGLPTGGQP